MTADAAPAADVQPNAKIFISYSRKDMAFADRLEATLKARGFEVFIDREEIYAFENWWKRLQALISSADTVIFVLSPDAVGSHEALREVEYAASLNKRFAPIVCRQVEDSAVPEALRQLNFIFFYDPAQFEESADRLAQALHTDIMWIREHTQFGETARAWVMAGRPSGLLLRTPALEMAEHWLGTRPPSAPEPTDDTRTFISASRQGARSARRLRRIALASIFTLLVSIILGLVGVIKQDFIIAQWHWWTVIRPYAAAQVWSHVLTAAQEQALKPGDSFKECAQDCPEMVVVPAGPFTMGGPFDVQRPLHTVTFAKPFAVSKYELAFSDWDACVTGGGCNGHRPNDQGWGRGQQPVINVSWDDARAYVAWFSQATGKTYRLLSEAEYEYAMRAGTTTNYPWGDDIKLNGQAMANCNGCGSKWDKQKTAPVGSFPPNKFGLYDMLGNAWEWTEDCSHNNYNGAPTNGSAWLADNGGDCTNRMMRGGSWNDPPDSLQWGFRGFDTTGSRISVIGFRLARTLFAP